MKKVLLLVIVLVAAGSAFAQVSFGVKGGLNLGKQRSETDGVSLTSDFRLSGHLGGFLIYELNDQFAIQPELLFSSEGGKYDISGFESKSVLSFINVPVLARYAATEKLNLVAGPQFGLLLSAKAKDDDTSTDIKDDVKGLNASLAFGLGYALTDNIEVYGRYNLGLTNLDDTNADGKNTLNTLQFGVAYKLK